MEELKEFIFLFLITLLRLRKTKSIPMNSKKLHLEKETAKLILPRTSYLILLKASVFKLSATVYYTKVRVCESSSVQWPYPPENSQ